MRNVSHVDCEMLLPNLSNIGLMRCCLNFLPYCLKRDTCTFGPYPNRY